MRRLYFSVIASFCIFISYAQDAASVFIDMPRNKIMLLADESRKSMVDLYTSGSQAKMTNVFGGESILTELTSDYLKLQLTDQNTFELRLLPSSGDSDKVVCVVRTACAPVCDSRIEFYSLRWEAMSAEELMPVFNSEVFLNDKDSGSEARTNALTALETSFFKYELNAANTNLTVSYTTPFFPGKEEREQLAPYLLDRSLVFHWTPEGFRY